MPNNISSPAKVAYIIVGWNNQKLLAECFNSIKGQTYQNTAIIYVDNASSDSSVEWVRQNYPQVMVLAQTKNLGFAKGNNVGIKRAMEDKTISYVILLNSDARLSPNWTSVLIETAELKPKAAMLQSLTLDYYDHNVIDSTHIYLSRFGQAIQSGWRRPLVDSYEPPAQKIFGCNAAAMMITRKFIEAQPFKNFFDEVMYMYLEDVDIAVRATVMGWDNWLLPGTRAYHMGSASAKVRSSSFSLYMTFRNNIGLLVKNLPGPILFHLLLNMPRADRSSIRHLKRNGQSSGIKYLIKGRLISILFVPYYLIQRRKLMSHKNIDSDYLWQLMRHGF